MKPETFQNNGGIRICVVLDQVSRLLDLTNANSSAPMFQSMAATIEAGPTAIDLATRLV
jgi:hypothetical protein